MFSRLLKTLSIGIKIIAIAFSLSLIVYESSYKSPDNYCYAAAGDVYPVQKITKADDQSYAYFKGSEEIKLSAEQESLYKNVDHLMVNQLLLLIITSVLVLGTVSAQEYLKSKHNLKDMKKYKKYLRASKYVT
jgi:hypothetical protein